VTGTGPGPSTSDVRAALAAVTDAAPWLRWRVDEGELRARADELPCAELAQGPGAVAASVAASADARGSEEPAVLASLWWQGYAYRVAGTALASWLLTGTMPDVRAEAMAVGIARGRPSSVVYLNGSAATDITSFVDRLFAGHLDLVASALRARHPMGAQLVWGNVAAASASAAGAVRDAAGASWVDRVAAFTEAAPHGLAALGDWSPTADGQWAFRRRTCCLWWKTTASGGALCADCSLHGRFGRGSRVPGAQVVGQQPETSQEVAEPARSGSQTPEPSQGSRPPA
jgi:ferric iron reductase protein FhuF